MDTQKVWFVTGASKGLGLALIKKLLATGYKVAATSRTIGALTKEVEETSDNFLPLEVDLVNEQSVKTAIATTMETFGTIDVVVNNAGYGQLGTLEELSDSESRLNFDVNVFGSLNVIRQAMPYMRERKSGHIINIASIGGFNGAFPGWGIYCATKFAVAGFTEGLAAEAADFGIHATVVYPGYFRTSFLTEGSLSIPKNPIEAYTKARESEEAHQSAINGNQPGDPDKAADVLIDLANDANPPVHLFLGQDAYNMAEAKWSTVQQDLAQYEAKAASATGFN